MSRISPRTSVKECDVESLTQLARPGAVARGCPDQSVDALRRLERLLQTRESATLTAVVVGPVHYRHGDGIALEVRRGVVDLEVTCTDTVLSWDDDRYRVEAAITYANFSHYVTAGAIRLGM
jgi:glutathione S-transferase